MDLIKQAATHLQNNLPFVVYHKPGTDRIHGVFQRDETLYTVKDFTEKGFLMAPFVSGAYPAVLIRPDRVLQEPYLMRAPQRPFDPAPHKETQLAKEEYLKKFGSALQAIQENTLEKVVLSRRITYALSRSPVDIYRGLLDQFPSAFGYLFYHPKVGLWMGASPETLLLHNGNQISTVSLAATQKVKNGEAPEWSNKEIREQEVVTRYIRNALEPCVQEIRVTAPGTYLAGNLYHLRSVVTGMGLSCTLREVIAQLHPTPAVCGVPLEASRDFLLKNEGYPRAYYTGYLGELNMNTVGESHFFVNLRCMNFESDRVYIYVGGGLVAGSVGEREWQETVIKSTSMGHLIMNS